MLETRPATADDAETLATLASTVFCEAYRAAFSSEQQVAEYVSKTFVPAAFATELNAASAWYTLGFVDGASAGFIKLERTAPPSGVGPEAAIELSKLYVLRQFHGCGIANQLMQRGLEYAGNQGLSLVWLCVWEHNARAQAFYRRWGFEAVGDLAISVDGVPFRDLVMTRSLHRTKHDLLRGNP